MKGHGFLTALLRFAGRVALIDVGIFAGVGVVCWLGGWRTAGAYGTGLIVAGVGAIVLGLASVQTSWGITRSGTYQLGQTVGVDSIGESSRRAMGEVSRSYGDLVRMALIGIVPIVAGSLIASI